MTAGNQDAVTSQFSGYFRIMKRIADEGNFTGWQGVEAEVLPGIFNFPGPVMVAYAANLIQVLFDSENFHRLQQSFMFHGRNNNLSEMAGSEEFKGFRGMSGKTA